MSARNVELARGLFAAFDAREVEAVLALIHPECEFHAVTAALAADGRPYRGHAGIRRYFTDIAAYWEELRVLPREYRDAGDAVVVLGRVYARGGSQVVDSPAGWVWRVRDGLFVWGKVFGDPGQVLEHLEREA